MNNPPCFRCVERKAGCHAICEKYAIYKRNRNYHNAKRRADSEATDVCIRMKAETSGRVRHYREDTW